MNRAYYSSTLSGFLGDRDERVLGLLAQNHQFALDMLQRFAWIQQIQILKHSLINLPEGYLYFEFAIPRMGKRVDTILILEGIIFVLEFKVGDKRYSRYGLDQVLDYALDLKNFHELSHDKPIIPILVATQAKPEDTEYTNPYDDNVYRPIGANRDNLGAIISHYLHIISSVPFDPIVWERSSYKPTPTIIEAAQALYRGHDVKEISRSDAGAINLSRTTDSISRIIEIAKSQNLKAICFITGVPGSGKTLAGLNIANERLKINEEEHAIFLSGNGPLVTVLREALARDEVNYARSYGESIKKKDAITKAQAFIQNIHHFRDDALAIQQAPIEKVVVFDEAQRAWTKDKSSAFMQQKRGVPEFNMSEPEFLISVMDRHIDWAIIICLIGGGQEIYTGEAGLPEWFDALKNHFPNWRVYLSSKINEFEYTRGRSLIGMLNVDQYFIDDDLHLAVSVRSYRSEKLSYLIKLLLDGIKEPARYLYKDIKHNYPIVITRDLEEARKWLRNKSRGNERYGLIASSGARRLKPFGINVKVDVDVTHWFLDSKDDVRSSYFLEDVATEFDVQGLELDWTCVVWGGDFRKMSSGWGFKRFRGSSWQNVNDEDQKLYLKNAYRVLLTRARQGMVIFIPEGNNDDLTRLPEFYDSTYNFLRNIGFEVI